MPCHTLRQLFGRLRLARADWADRSTTIVRHKCQEQRLETAISQWSNDQPCIVRQELVAVWPSAFDHFNRELIADLVVLPLVPHGFMARFTSFFIQGRLLERVLCAHALAHLEILFRCFESILVTN